MFTRTVQSIILISLLLYAHSFELNNSSQTDGQAEPNSLEPGLTEPKPEPEPTGGPAAEGTSEPAPEGTVEPAPEGTVDPEGTDHTEPPFAEPEPEWSFAKQLWGVGWQIHVYGFGALFAVICLYSFISVIRLWRKKHLLSQPYFISLNFLVMMTSCFRSIYLLVDAYNSRHTFPHLVSYLLNSTVFPCITSMFSLMFFALLSATRMTFISKTIQKPRLILMVVLTHFTMSVVADVLIGLNFDARILLLVCQMVYITWGLFLFIGFMTIFKRLYKAALSRQKLMNKYMLSRFSISSKKNQQTHKFTLGVGVKVALVSSMFGLITVALLIYGMADVYGVFNYDVDVDPWKWFAYNTTFRALELCMCITVSFVATQPFRYTSKRSDDSSSCSCHCYACAPCLSWFYREHSYLLPDVSWSDFNSEWDGGASSVRRNESQKSDYPLHHIRRYSQESSSLQKQAKTPMLKEDHGQLHFTNGSELPGSKENGAYYNINNSSSNTGEEATLKIERELQFQTEKTILLTSEDGSLTRTADQTRTANNHNSDLVRAESQPSFSGVSEFSAEMDASGTDNSGTELDQLVADV